MAKGCKKCDPHEICEECPEWIFTLADLIMCMMGLFVILWVLKDGNKAKAGEPGSEDLTKVVAAIREAFGHIPEPNSNDPVDMFMLLQQVKRLKNVGPGETGKVRLESKGADGTDPEVTTIRVGRQATVGGRLLFERGEARLTAEAIDQLNQIVLQIRGHRNVVVINGHASLDDQADADASERGMDLSLRRAQAVRNYIISKGVAPVILRVRGSGIDEPVVERAYTPSAQLLNRRVEVEVTPTLVDELKDPPKDSPHPVTTPTAPTADPLR